MYWLFPNYPELCWDMAVAGLVNRDVKDQCRTFMLRYPARIDVARHVLEV
ncbi:MAG: hypothetical protein ACNA8W_19380 [Bradymonadaceae bacterium]